MTLHNLAEAERLAELNEDKLLLMVAEENGQGSFRWMSGPR